MKQKLAYMSVGVIFTLILSFSFLSFASPTTEVVGNLTFIDEANNQISLFDGKKKWDFRLDSNTVIYRNDQQVSLSALTHKDEVKVILNSNDQARYVVATYKDRENQAVPAASVSLPATSNKGESLKTEDQKIEDQQQLENQIQTENGQQIYIHELKVKVEYHGKNEWKLEYKNDKGKIESKLERKVGNGKDKNKSKKSDVEIERLIQSIDLNANMSKHEVAEKIVTELGLSKNNYKKVEVEIKLSNDETIELKHEEKDHGKDHDDDDDHEDDNDNDD